VFASNERSILLRTEREAMETTAGKKLYDHVFDTYISLRVGMAYIAFAFPIIVIAVGYFADDSLPIQDSLSAYYWATNNGFNPTRIAFVGGLFAVGAFLYLYKGFTWKENLALNAAALFAIGVACFPMKWTCEGCGGWTPHGICAFGLFGCLVYVVWFRARDTLKFLPAGISARPFRALYGLFGLCMAVSPVVALAINWTVGENKFVISVEILGIWSFAAYWLAKGKELSLSNATKMALSQTLPVPVEATSVERTGVPAT
jgi:hypothetical protein